MQSCSAVIAESARRRTSSGGTTTDAVPIASVRGALDGVVAGCKASLATPTPTSCCRASAESFKVLPDLTHASGIGRHVVAGTGLHVADAVVPPCQRYRIRDSLIDTRPVGGIMPWLLEHNTHNATVQLQPAGGSERTMNGSSNGIRAANPMRLAGRSKV